jgi:hypothetical protein
MNHNQAFKVECEPSGLGNRLIKWLIVDTCNLCQRYRLFCSQSKYCHWKQTLRLYRPPHPIRGECGCVWLVCGCHYRIVINCQSDFWIYW